MKEEIERILEDNRKRLLNAKRSQQLSIDSGHWIGAHDKKNTIRHLEGFIQDLEQILNV